MSLDQGASVSLQKCGSLRSLFSSSTTDDLGDLPKSVITLETGSITSSDAGSLNSPGSGIDDSLSDDLAYETWSHRILSLRNDACQLFKLAQSCPELAVSEAATQAFDQTKGVAAAATTDAKSVVSRHTALRAPALVIFFKSLRDESAEVRLAAATALRRCGAGLFRGAARPVVDELATHLADTEAAVRDAVVAVLLDACGEHGLAAMYAVARTGKLLGRRAALHALNSPKHIALFCELLGHGDARVRVCASEALARLGDHRGSRDIFVALASDEHELRALALSVISSVNPPHLRQLSRSPSTVGLRRKSV